MLKWLSPTVHQTKSTRTQLPETDSDKRNSDLCCHCLHFNQRLIFCFHVTKWVCAFLSPEIIESTNPWFLLKNTHEGTKATFLLKMDWACWAKIYYLDVPGLINLFYSSLETTLSWSGSWKVQSLFWCKVDTQTLTEPHAHTH